MDKPQADDEHYSEEETVARREAALKRMLNTPATQHHAKPTRNDKATRGRPPKPKD